MAKKTYITMRCEDLDNALMTWTGTFSEDGAYNIELPLEVRNGDYNVRIVRHFRFTVTDIERY